ncbi:MAG: L,D-transpeptidase [Anaerolineales bacterium]|nr:L,D-transpeptidase [Anaerolineales bacterium]
MEGRIQRRSFLQMMGLSVSALAIKPPPPYAVNDLGIGRVSETYINLYREPSFKAPILTTLGRDSLLPLQDRIRADEGPVHNPVWFQIPDGFVHSGNIQTVAWKPQKPRMDVPETGSIFEVSVPYTRTFRNPDPGSDPLYRLYYQATAWVVGVEKGSDGRWWYCLLDDLLNVKYYARAEHLRRVEPEELTPISPDVPTRDKYIDVNLAQQELLAFERNKLVFRTRISSGIPDSRPKENGIPTATPRGQFYVDKKMPLRHMGNGRLTANLEAYELPGVPWVSYFHMTGVAFHGTYWHTDYGRPRSHGCINMRPEEAKWLFRWTQPVVEADVKLEWGYGTPVYVY